MFSLSENIRLPKPAQVMHADHNNYIQSMEANYDVFYVCTSSVRRYNFYVLRQTNASKSIPRKFSQIGGLNYDPHIRLLLVQE